MRYGFLHGIYCSSKQNIHSSGVLSKDCKFSDYYCVFDCYTDWYLCSDWQLEESRIHESKYENRDTTLLLQCNATPSKHKIRTIMVEQYLELTWLYCQVNPNPMYTSVDVITFNPVPLTSIPSPHNRKP